MSSAKKMTVKDCITDYKETCKKIQELERYKDALHNKLTEYMQDKSLKTLQNDQYTVKLTNQSRDSISKKNLPPEIYNQYKQTISFPRLTITANKTSKSQ